jgi:hypothetical protein
MFVVVPQTTAGCLKSIKAYHSWRRSALEMLSLISLEEEMLCLKKGIGV